MSSTANITLRQLRVFLAVAELRNFSRAGDRMGLTQPAVSRIIHELESQVGLALVNRTTRLVELCLLYTSPSPRDRQKSRMPSSA